MNKRLYLSILTSALAFSCLPKTYAQTVIPPPPREQNRNEHSNTETIFKYVEQQPVFQGNLGSWLGAELVYPPFANNNGIEGKSYIQFIVDENGDVNNVTVLRHSYPLLDSEALRVIRLLPRWKPGKNGNQAVKCYFSIPIDFTLDDGYASNGSNDVDSCHHSFKSKRSLLYTEFPKYNGDFKGLEVVHVPVGKDYLPLKKMHLLVTITKKGLITSPVVLCNNDEALKQKVLSAFGKKMALQNTTHLWTAAVKDNTPVDCPIILSLTVAPE